MQQCNTTPIPEQDRSAMKRMQRRYHVETVY